MPIKFAVKIIIITIKVLFIEGIIEFILTSYSPVNRIGSPQGFSISQTCSNLRQVEYK